MATTGEKATGTITIEYNTVTVTPGADGDVWLTPSEIARMFEVFVPAITSNIRAIYTPQSAAFRRWLIRRPHSRMVVLKVSQEERTVVN